MPTIKDVAKRAGVSVATVSRCLSGGSHVATKTKERVLRAAAELNYRPNQIARSLRRRRTTVIALIISTIENVFFTEVAHASELAARERGYNLIVCNTNEDPALEATYLKILDQQLIAGVVLAPAPGDAPHLTPYIENGLPVVLINRRLNSVSCSSIVSDDRNAAYQCVSGLLAKGRKRVAAITGLPNIYTTKERLAGYEQVLREAGLEIDPTLQICGWAGMEGGYGATYQLMNSANPPDSLFAFNNVMTQGAVIAVQEMGLRWPEDIDISGFGAFKTSHLYQPRLTLVQQPAREMGRKSVELLVEQIEDPTQNAQQIVLNNQITTEATSFLAP
ncbi:MAG: LacI family transcriptional regulator [Caldilineaceae bacterium]|nr:LacI family transcriptional regulator [Caldilineaceae bacterium]